MRLVYLILAHQLPGQLLRLVDRLRGPRATLLVHLDRRMDAGDAAFVADQLAGCPDVLMLRRHPCHWGTFSIVRATLEGIHRAVAERLEYDYLALLSGQDYPIKPRSEIDAVLASLGGRSVMEHVALPKPDWRHGGWDRVERWYFPPGRMNRHAERLANRYATPRRFPRGFRPYAGAQFWCLSRPAVEYLDSFARRNRAYARFFHHVFVPDEFYFHTALANSPLARYIVSDCPTFLEWHRPGAVLTSDDLPSLTATWRLFARKFDARVDERVLDLIDARLLDPGED